MIKLTTNSINLLATTAQQAIVNLTWLKQQLYCTVLQAGSWLTWLDSLCAHCQKSSWSVWCVICVFYRLNVLCMLWCITLMTVKWQAGAAAALYSLLPVFLSLVIFIARRQGDNYKTGNDLRLRLKYLWFKDQQ